MPFRTGICRNCGEHRSLTLKNDLWLCDSCSGEPKTKYRELRITKEMLDTAELEAERDTKKWLEEECQKNIH